MSKMICKKVVILGGGPSGLALALALVDLGMSREEFVVVEQEEVTGGLCRSQIVDGAPLDIGGGHFLDLRREEVLDFLFRFMPRQEWNVHERVSKIRIRAMEVDHPLEANLWQFPHEIQVDYLESIAQAGCVRGEPVPESFSAWIKWKLGERIAEEYMLPYNRKLWSMNPDELGTYWLHKLPNVSFRDTLRSCLEARATGSLPAHGTFLYPRRHGYGEVWQRMGEALGDSLVTGCPVKHIDLSARTVNGRWQADTIISTIPWTLWPSYCNMPQDILSAIGSLRNVSIDVEYQEDAPSTSSHWTYEPDEAVPHHRILFRQNFVPGARGYWTESNAARSKPASGIRFHNPFAYPINTLGKPDTVRRILTWARKHRIIGLGRWGRWEHMNSDVAVAEALQMARELVASGVSG